MALSVAEGFRLWGGGEKRLWNVVVVVCKIRSVWEMMVLMGRRSKSGVSAGF